MPRKLAIVIPSHNRISTLQPLLSQIESQKARIEAEILVIPVIDGSNDGTIELIKETYPDHAMVVGPGNWWFTRCLNKGVYKAREWNADFVLTLNDDVILSEGFLQQIDKYLPERGTENRLIGAISFASKDKRLITQSGVKKIHWWRSKLVNYFELKAPLENPRPTGLKPVVTLVTRGLLIPKEALLRLNGFDEAFPQYFSDFDFCLRAAKKGFNLFISYELIIYSIDELTQKSSSSITSVGMLLKSFKNPYSRNYIPHMVRYFWRHGNRLAIPFTLTLVYGLMLVKVLRNKYNKEGN